MAVRQVVLESTRCSLAQAAQYVSDYGRILKLSDTMADVLIAAKKPEGVGTKAAVAAVRPQVPIYPATAAVALEIATAPFL